MSEVQILTDGRGKPLTSTDGALNVHVQAGTITAANTLADGADINAGKTTDAALTSSAAGTLSAKLRGLVKWAYERMPVSLGQKSMAASLPVVLPSDQTIAVSVASFTGSAASDEQIRTRRLTEELTLRALEDSWRDLLGSESYTSHRRGFELR